MSLSLSPLSCLSSLPCVSAAVLGIRWVPWLYSCFSSMFCHIIWVAGSPSVCADSFLWDVRMNEILSVRHHLRSMVWYMSWKSRWSLGSAVSVILWPYSKAPTGFLWRTLGDFEWPAQIRKGRYKFFNTLGLFQLFFIDRFSSQYWIYSFLQFEGV